MHAVVHMASLRRSLPNLSSELRSHQRKAAPGRRRSPRRPCGHLPRAGPWAQDRALSEATSWGGETWFDFSLYEKKEAGARKQPLTEPLSFPEGLIPGAGGTRPHFPPRDSPACALAACTPSPLENRPPFPTHRKQKWVHPQPRDLLLTSQNLSSLTLKMPFP